MRKQMDNDDTRQAAVLHITTDDFDTTRIPLDITRETVIVISAGNKSASDNQR
jgi:hypothetical protein